MENLEGRTRLLPSRPSAPARPESLPATPEPTLPQRSGSIADEVLVARVLSGETHLFEHLVVRYERGIVNFIFRMIGDYEQALDLAQEVFFKVYRSLPRFDPTFRFSTWLYRIASNRSIDHLRKRNPMHLPLDAPARSDAGGEAAVQLRSANRGPEDLLASVELGRQIGEAIEALPPAYRELVLLRHLEGMPYSTIARVKRLPLGTVKNRLFRAREILRRRLSP